jgi:hypothetical protein
MGCFRLPVKLSSKFQLNDYLEATEFGALTSSPGVVRKPLCPPECDIATK